MATPLDLGGNNLIINELYTGATSPGQAGTELTSANLTVLASATNANSGTGKAVITGTSGALTVAGVATFNANPTFGTGNTLKLNSGTSTLSSNAATVTKYAGQITTESLTTAAGASQAQVITLTGAAATDLVFITKAGGTNTRHNYQIEGVMTSNTLTVTIYNTEPSNALNGTLIYNVWIVKA